MGSTVKVREKYQVTIPDNIRTEIPLKVGERVEVLARDGEIIIRPVVEVPRAQAWFWTQEWQAQVEKSLSDVKAGKVKIFRSVKEAKKHVGD